MHQICTEIMLVTSTHAMFRGEKNIISVNYIYIQLRKVYNLCKKKYVDFHLHIFGGFFSVLTQINENLSINNDVAISRKMLLTYSQDVKSANNFYTCQIMSNSQVEILFCQIENYRYLLREREIRQTDIQHTEKKT